MSVLTNSNERLGECNDVKHLKAFERLHRDWARLALSQVFFWMYLTNGWILLERV